MAFGLGREFWVLAVTRALQGICNGNIGVTKSVMAEITDSSNMGSAFAFIPVAWATGVTIGPIIGGTLAHPADRWSFADSPFLRTFPYFLPCFVASLAPLIIFLLGWFYLKETLPSIINAKPRDSEAAAQARRGEVVGNSSYDPAASSADDSEPKHTFITLLSRKEVLIPVINHSFLALMEQCFIVLLPLVYSTSIPNGGLGLSAFEIGTIMGAVGFINGIFQVVFFAKFLDRLGPKKLYILCYSSVFIAILAYPVMSSFAKAAGRVDGAVWCVLIVQVCCNLTIYMAYGCSFMYTVDAAPSHSSLGVTNGLAQMVSTVTRTIAPTLASSLFSISQQKQWLGGTMVYWALCLIGSIGVYTAGFLPGKLKER
jgi:MFS family permease